MTRRTSAASLVVGERAGRRQRRDFGSVRMSERDARLLLLIGEQYAVTVDQLARLIGRTYRTARWLRDRWQNAGWVASRQLIAGGPSYVWLTREGTRVAQSPHRTWEPNPGMAAHIEAVTEIRLLLEEQLGLGEWQSERTLAKTYGPRSELQARKAEKARRARLDELVRDLGERYQQVWYFAAARLVPTLTEVASLARWQNVQVHHHPPLLHELRLAA